MNEEQLGQQIAAIWEAIEILQSAATDAQEHFEALCDSGAMLADEVTAECNQCGAGSNHSSNAGTLCQRCKRGTWELRHIVYPETAAPELDAAINMLVDCWQEIGASNPHAVNAAHNLRAAKE